MARLASFAGLWLLVGFSSGSAALLGPVRWLTLHARAAGWSPDVERLVVVPLVAAYVVLSALVALWLTASLRRSRLLHVRLGVPLLCLAAAGGALWLWMTPEALGAGGGETEAVGRSFTFGSYPTEERMRELKREGYTAVVSLLHPLVVPFEPKLIADGRAAAERAGLEYVNVPMLPWVSDNGEALARIEQLARSGGRQRLYVHCYLGKDRVRLVKRLVEQIDPTAQVAVTADLDAHQARRRLEDGMRLERGVVVRVAPEVFLTPFPTDNEFMSYILPGTHGQVLSLLDPDDDGDRAWIDKERELLRGHRLPFELRPLPHAEFDPARALAVAREAAAMPRPFVVHAFLAVDSGRSPSAEAFLQAFRSDLPPLPPALFVEPLARGAAQVLAPNVALGPRPAPGEFRGSLWSRGVREFVYVGDGAASEARADRATCRAAGVPWHALDGRADELLALVSAGGPWYLYGPWAAKLAPEVTAALGPAIPPESRRPHAPAAPPREETAAEPPGPAAGRWNGFDASLLPSISSIVLLGPILLLAVSLAAAFAGWLRATREVSAPYTRKIFHFAIFTAAGLLHLLGGLSAVALFGGIVSAAVVYAVWRGDGFPFFEALARPSDAPRRSLFVLLPLATTALGGLGANLLFGAAAPVGYLVAGWGDAIAEPVGTRWGRHRYRVPSIGGVPATRSLEGSVAVLVVGSLAAFVGLQLGGAPLATSLAAAAACGAAGAAVEAISNHGLDNLTVQLAAAGTAYVFLL